MKVCVSWYGNIIQTTLQGKMFENSIECVVDFRKGLIMQHDAFFLQCPYNIQPSSPRCFKSK